MSRAYLFTLEAVGRCANEAEAEYFLRVAAHALQEAGFGVSDAQAIGIDGGKGAALDFDEPVPQPLHDPRPKDATQDTRRMSDMPGQM